MDLCVSSVVSVPPETVIGSLSITNGMWACMKKQGGLSKPTEISQKIIHNFPHALALPTSAHHRMRCITNAISPLQNISNINVSACVVQQQHFNKFTEANRTLILVRFLKRTALVSAALSKCSSVHSCGFLAFIYSVVSILHQHIFPRSGFHVCNFTGP